MNQTILITGDSRGIGKATVQKFLEEGWHVITTSTTGELDYEHENVLCFPLRLEDEVSIGNFVEELQKEEVKIDVLINNAGMKSKVRHPERNDIAEMRQIFEVFVFGLVNLTESLIENLSRNAQIINISSEFGAFSDDWGWVVPPYRMAKAALNMYTRNLYQAPFILNKNISVCSFEPGWVKTDMGGENAPRDPSEPADEIFDLVNNGFESGLFYSPDGRREW